MHWGNLTPSAGPGLPLGAGKAWCVQSGQKQVPLRPFGPL